MHLYPKLALFLAGAGFLGLGIARQSEGMVYDRGWAIVGTLWSSTLLVSTWAHGPTSESALAATVLLSAGVILWALWQATESQRALVIKGLVVIAAFQAAYGCFEALLGQRAIGTVGNSEFYSVLLLVGILMSAHLYDVGQLTRRVWCGLQLLLCAGLFASLAKGSILFCALFLVERSVVRLRKWQWLSLGALGIVAIALWSVSVEARAFLWLIGAKLLWENPLWGVGLERFEAHYFDTISGLFQTWPALRTAWGSFSGTVTDAHQLFLGMGAEAGVLGCVAAGALFLKCLERVRQSSSRPWQWLIALFLFKAMYTVSLRSPTFVALFLVALAFSGRPLDRRTFAWPTRSLAALPGLVGLFVLFPLILGSYSYQRASTDLHAGRFMQARAWSDRAIQWDAENADYFLARAFAKLNLGAGGESEDDLGRALRLKRDLNVLKIAARIDLLSGRESEALQKYLLIHHVYPEHLTSIVRIAELYQRLGQAEEARRFALQALTLRVRVPTKSHDTNLILAENVLRASKYETEQER
jgi:hypothetical protein